MLIDDTNNSSSNPSPLLQMKGLRIEGLSDQGWQEIVCGIDLKLNRGEILGLIGESGAGKSTIGLAAMGFAKDGCRIVDGEIDFDGIELRKAPESQKRKLRGTRISYVAQSAAAAFNPAHRLINQFTEGPIEHDLLSEAKAKEKGRNLYRSLDLPDPDHIGDRWPHQVSGGQIQRMMVAMSMSCEPDLIIFDEPTTALDVTVQLQILNLIKNLQKKLNMAILFISHDLTVVKHLADYICIMKDGIIVENNKKENIFFNPKLKVLPIVEY